MHLDSSGECPAHDRRLDVCDEPVQLCVVRLEAVKKNLFCQHERLRGTEGVSLPQRCVSTQRWRLSPSLRRTFPLRAVGTIQVKNTHLFAHSAFVVALTAALFHSGATATETARSWSQKLLALCNQPPAPREKMHASDFRAAQDSRRIGLLRQNEGDGARERCLDPRTALCLSEHRLQGKKTHAPASPQAYREGPPRSPLVTPYTTYVHRRASCHDGCRRSSSAFLPLTGGLRRRR